MRAIVCLCMFAERRQATRFRVRPERLESTGTGAQVCAHSVEAQLTVNCVEILNNGYLLHLETWPRRSKFTLVAIAGV